MSNFDEKLFEDWAATEAQVYALLGRLGPATSLSGLRELEQLKAQAEAIHGAVGIARASDSGSSNRPVTLSAIRRCANTSLPTSKRRRGFVFRKRDRACQTT